MHPEEKQSKPPGGGPTAELRVWIPVQFIEQLDAVAAERGDTRTVVAREAVRWYLSMVRAHRSSGHEPVVLSPAGFRDRGAKDVDIEDGP